MTAQWLVTNGLNHTYWMSQMVRMNRVRFLESPIKACLLLEGIIIVSILIQLVCYVFVMVLWKPLHINIRVLCTGQFIGFGLGFTSRLVMILYEAEVIPCKTLADFPLPLLHTFRLWNYNMVFQIPLTITLERFFATLYLRDYENRTRPLIGALIMVPVMAATFAMSALSVNDVIDGNKATALSMLPIALFIYLFGRLLRVNEAEMDRLHQLFERSRSSAIYSLSLRVQLNENISIMKVTSGPLLILLLSAPIDILSVSLPSFLITDEDLFWVLDICSAAANLIVVSAATVAPAVAYQFIRHYKNRVAPFRMQFTAPKTSIYVIEDALTSSLHFDMLQIQWERASEERREGERNKRISIETDSKSH